MKSWPKPFWVSLALLLAADSLLLGFLVLRDGRRAEACPPPTPAPVEPAIAAPPEPIEPAPIDDPRWQELRSELRTMAEAQALAPAQLQDVDDALDMIGAHVGAGSRKVVIDVGSAHGRLYLRNGWSVDEELGDGRTAVWSSEPRSEIDLVLVPGGQDWWLEILAHAATRDGISEQPVEVILNGERAGELHFPAGWNIRGLRVPHHLLVRGRNRLVLRYLTPIGVPGDPRTLTLYVDQLWIAPDQVKE